MNVRRFHVGDTDSISPHTEDLLSDEAMAAFVSDVFATGNPACIACALAAVARTNYDTHCSPDRGAHELLEWTSNESKKPQTTRCKLIMHPELPVYVRASFDNLLAFMTEAYNL